MSSQGEKYDWSSDDEFDQLSGNLPQFTYSFSESNPQSFFNDKIDEFSQWQLGRFNRAGNIDLCEMLPPSLNVVHRNLKILTFFYLIYAILAIISIKLHIPFLTIIINSIFYLFATSVCFSLIAGEPFSSRFHFIISLQGLIAFSIQMLRSAFLFFTAKSLFYQKSIMSIRLFGTMVVRFLTFYHPCFTFEGRTLSLSATFSFSIRLSIKAIPFVQSATITLFCELLSILGFVSFGFSTWISNFIRSFIFLAVCGSGSSVLTP